MVSISEQPFLGVGFGNFNYVLGENASALKKGSSAHSIYFDIAAEVGILGLIIFLLLNSNIAIQDMLKINSGMLTLDFHCARKGFLLDSTRECHYLPEIQRSLDIAWMLLYIGMYVSIILKSSLMEKL